jgi:hypothetical protein
MTKGTQRRLEEELEILKHVLNLSCNILVRWEPNFGSKLAGEVKRNIIFIYERDCEEAIKTLRHEVIDYLVSQAIEPYKEVTNRLIKMVNEDAYKRKENVVEALTRLIEMTDN